MDAQTLLILGGYGHVGSLLSRYLLQETQANVVIAGRRMENAEALRDKLNSVFAGKRASAAYADASKLETVKAAMQGAQCIVMASPTFRYAKGIITAALESGKDYVDILYEPAKTDFLKSIIGEVRRAGRCFITDCGIAPGLAAALVRYAAPRFDRLEGVRVAAALRMNFNRYPPVRETVYEQLRVLNSYRHMVYRDGRWRNMGPLGLVDSVNFGGTVGRQMLATMFIEEMRAVPELYPSVRDARFVMGGFNWFVTWLAFPAATVSLALAPRAMLRPMGAMVAWGFTQFSEGPYGVWLKLEATGVKDGAPKVVDVTLHHDDGYAMTASSVTACLMQYLDGSIRKPGVWMEATAIEPERAMTYLQRMGVKLDVSEPAAEAGRAAKAAD